MNIGDLFMSLRIDSAEFKKSVEGIGKMALGALGVVGVAVSAIGLKAAIDWESAFAGVRKTVDASEEDLQKLENQLRDMAGTLGMTAVELAGLAEQAGALGIKTPDIAEFVRVSAMLGVTTDVSADMAATALGKINSVIPLTSEEMERFASTLVDLGNKGASTESQILDMAQNMAGAASVVGMSIPQMLGWATAAANVGIEAEAGSSSFQRLALGVQQFVVQGGPKLEEIARLTGMTADEFKELFSRDASAAMQAIIGGLAEMDGNTRSATLAALGFTDIRLTKYLLTLSANADNLNSSLLTGASAWDENTAMGVEFGKRAETVEFQMSQMRAELTEVAIIIGEALLPHFRNFIGLVKDLALGIGNWMKENKGLVDTLTPILAVLSGILALKWGGNFIGGLLGQLGLGTLGRLLANAIIPGATFAGTAAGTAQGGAHAAAAGSPGVISMIVAKIAAMQMPLAAAGTTVGTAVGTAMALGIAAGIILIGTHVIAEAVNNATNAAREKIANNPNSITTADLFQSRAPAWAVKKLEIAKEMQNLGVEALAAFNAEWEQGLKDGLMANDPTLLERARQAGLAIGGTVGTAATDALVDEGVLGGEAWALASLDGFANADWGAATAAVEAHGRATAIAGQEAILNVFRNGDWGAAAAAARGVIAELNRGLQESLPSARQTWKDFVNGIGKELDPLDELAWLKGKLSGKRLAEGLASENPFARQNAEDMRDTIVTEIAKLERLLGIEGIESGAALGDGIDSPANRTNARNAGENLSGAAYAGTLNQPWGSGGANAAGAWTDGFIRGIGTKRIRTALDQLSQPFRGDSPPKVGPLKHIDKWGENIGRAWAEGLAKGIGGLNLTSSMSALSMPILRGNATTRHEHIVKLDLENAPPGITNDGVAQIVARTLRDFIDADLNSTESYSLEPAF